jgi:dimethylhistidine N-methyltransferase
MASTAQDKQGMFFYDYNLQVQDQQEEILEGLSQSPKRISAKYFYDQKGSQLFEAITKLPEYYPTRSEINLLRKHKQAILDKAGENNVLIEYGSGASTKIRLLLDALKPQAYVPLDISKDFLYDSAIELKKLFPWLEIHATCLDYRHPATLPKQLSPHAKKVAFFPGSSLGNFAPTEALDFLKNVRQTIGKNGAFLIGLDLIKNHDVLNAAYNDQQGITGAFNLNMLTHLNELGEGSFNLDYFEHKAFFNEKDSRIEMHLVSKIDQVVNIFSTPLAFKKHEHIVTEYSYKFEPSMFMEFARQAGFEGKHVWKDEGSNFALFWLESI